jgi:hypothetical protein
MGPGAEIELSVNATSYVPASSAPDTFAHRDHDVTDRYREMIGVLFFGKDYGRA